MFNVILEKLRKERKLTQQEIALKLGIARTTYSGYERGTSEPDNKTLEKIADFFGVDIDELFGRSVPKVENEMNRRLLEGLSKLSEEDKEYLIGLIERMPKKKD